MQEEEDNRRHIKDTVYVGRTDREGDTVSLKTESSGETIYRKDDEVVVVQDEAEVEVSETKTVDNLSSSKGGTAYVIDSNTRITTSADKIISNAKPNEIMKKSWDNSFKNYKYKLIAAPANQFGSGLAQGAADATVSAIKSRMVTPDYKYDVTFYYKLDDHDLSPTPFDVIDVASVKGLIETKDSAMMFVKGDDCDEDFADKDGRIRSKIEMTRILSKNDLKNTEVDLKNPQKKLKGSLFQLYEMLSSSKSHKYTLSAVISCYKKKLKLFKSYITDYTIINIKLLKYSWRRDGNNNRHIEAFEMEGEVFDSISNKEAAKARFESSAAVAKPSEVEAENHELF